MSSLSPGQLGQLEGPPSAALLGSLRLRMMLLKVQETESRTQCLSLESIESEKTHLVLWFCSSVFNPASWHHSKQMFFVASSEEDFLRMPLLLFGRHGLPKGVEEGDEGRAGGAAGSIFISTKREWYASVHASIEQSSVILLIGRGHARVLARSMSMIASSLLVLVPCVPWPQTKRSASRHDHLISTLSSQCIHCQVLFLVSSVQFSLKKIESTLDKVG